MVKVEKALFNNLMAISVYNFTTVLKALHLIQLTLTVLDVSTSLLSESEKGP